MAATSSIITLATSIAFTSPELANAGSININSFEKQQHSIVPEYVIPEREDVKGFEDYLTETDTLLSTLQGLTNWNVKKITAYQFIYSKFPSYSVEVVPNTKKDELLSPEFVGTSELSHTGGTNKQTLYSSSFSKAITSTVTSTTTHGGKVGSKAGGKLKLPLVAEGSVELTAEYNFAQACSKTDTETITYTVPAQPVKLKPNEKAVVTATLKMMESTGDVKLRTAYSGEINTNYINYADQKMEHSELMGNWVKTLLAQRENHGLNGILDYSRTEPNVAYQDGKGTYQAKYGSKMTIEVNILPKNTKTADGTPIRSYSYEVTPEIIEIN
ncbi:hypothetical protein COM24_17715 [Bacillus toyonensis]|uniref:ETX/MTX2 family pore-forming toxin n=1 Tax=Bacillus toyonensis TaxID=155322 RepID=UPI000BF9C3F7|nr:hypothetical protein COM24_17715 [Bacillus toyonensis]